ncbi:hypothetical protein EsH8_III_000518 [Colletotrichum jinshuiense]
MASYKYPLLAVVVLFAQAIGAQNAQGFQLLQSPPRTVSGEHGCYTDFGQEWRGRVRTYSRLYSYTFPVTEYTYTTPTTTTVTVTPTGNVHGTVTTTTTITATTHLSSTTILTVRAPSGFTPLASIIARADASSGLQQYAEDTDNSSDITQDELSLSVNKEGRLKSRPPLWPQQVVCEQVVRVFTTTTATITATRASTTTTTLPGPSVQTTVSTTVTTTATVIDIVANPTQTVYEACQANNLKASHGDPPSYFVEAVHGWLVSREERRTESPEGCCIACQNTPNCGGSLYHGLSRTCYIFKTRRGRSQCGSPGELRSTANVTDASNFWASNGQCGSWRISDERPGTPTDDF